MKFEARIRNKGIAVIIFNRPERFLYLPSNQPTNQPTNTKNPNPTNQTKQTKTKQNKTIL